MKTLVFIFLLLPASALSQTNLPNTFMGAPPENLPLGSSDVLPIIQNDNIKNVPATALAPPFVQPLAYGCAGNGSADDTACVQRTIEAASAAGLPMFFDGSHRYLITSTLNVTQPAALLGPLTYGYGIGVAPTSPTFGCSWGLFNDGTGITLLNVSAPTARIEGVCIQIAPNDRNPRAGAAIVLAPPSGGAQSGVIVEKNTIVRPYNGIMVGGGPSSTCCGANTTIGSIISNNTIRDPTGLAIANGQHTYGAATSGNTYWNNNIFCGSAASKATGVGFALFDGDIDYNGTNNGPEACNIGFEVVPGTVSGKAQNVGGQFRGALGDQSAIHDLLIQPSTALGTVDFFDAVNAWAATTGNRRTVLVDCATGSCQEISFVGSNFHGGTGQAVPVMDIEGGSGGPYDLSIVGSNICQFGTPGANGIALKINETSAGNGRIVVSGNRLGTGCPGRALHTGIWLAVSGGSGLVTITGNDISAVNTPISYAPTGTDHVIVANNMGLDDIFTAVADAATIDPGLYPRIVIRGTGKTVTSINRGYVNRQLRIVTRDGAVSFATGGNICNAVTSSGALGTVLADYDATASCWSMK